MTHNSNHHDFPVQNAGQAVGAALSLEPLPRNLRSPFRQGPVSAVRSATQISSPSAGDGRLSGGAVRVAGGESMSKDTSTAALASFRQSSLPTQRRAPRHQQSFALVTLPCSAGLHARQAPNVFRAFAGTAFRGGPFATTKVSLEFVLVRSRLWPCRTRAQFRGFSP
jgi:hypothetical protein